MCRCELEAAIYADMEAAGIAEADDTCAWDNHAPFFFEIKNLLSAESPYIMGEYEAKYDISISLLHLLHRSAHNPRLCAYSSRVTIDKIHSHRDCCTVRTA